MEMKRTFHPVGHGAFYTERFYDGENNIANIVFDCGCFEVGKEGQYKKRIENNIKSEFQKGVKIDALFISHFHQDHILGVQFLIKHCSVDKIFIPVLTPSVVIEAYLYIYNMGYKINCYANNLLRRYYLTMPKNIITINEFEDGIQPTEDPIILDETTVQSSIDSPSVIRMGRGTNWLYIPYNRKDPRYQELIEKIPQEKGFENIINDGKVDIDALSKTISRSGVSKCKKIYKSIFGDKHNSYSMTLYSGRACREQGCLPACLRSIEEGRNHKLCTINCLYMGDYEAKKEGYFDSLQRFYSGYWGHIGLLQVPHHGSYKNYNEGLYAPEKICIISAGITDKYRHPDQPTLDGILGNNCIPIIVTENPKTKQQFTYNI